MKALSIQQPWAWLIAAGHKDYENRTWHTSFTGRIYIHAGKKIATRDDREWAKHLLHLSANADGDETFIGFVESIGNPVNRGAIIGEVDIVGCDHIEVPYMWNYGPHGFRLENAELYAEPIPLRGQLGFFNVDLPVNISS